VIHGDGWFAIPLFASISLLGTLSVVFGFLSLTRMLMMICVECDDFVVDYGSTEAQFDAAYLSDRGPVFPSLCWIVGPIRPEKSLAEFLAWRLRLPRVVEAA
jgi:hypothetical protein